MDKFKQELNLVWQRSKALLILLLVITLFGVYFINRYSISVNGAKSDCLNASVFLVDKWDKTVHTGDIVVFRMQIKNSIHPVGTTWAKKVVRLFMLTITQSRSTTKTIHYQQTMYLKNSTWILQLLKLSGSWEIVSYS
jgi:hypothetical protein